MRIAGVLVFGICACGPREKGEPQRGESVRESVSSLGTTGPSVSEEFHVAERVLVPSAGWRLDIGAGATSHLVAFLDTRDDSSSFANLFGMRVGFDGALLDSLPFVISSGSGAQGMAKVAFNGTNWLVAWRDGRVRFEEHIYAARVSQDGTVLDPNGIALATGPGAKEPSGVASDGTDFLVVWDFEGTQAAIVSASGTVERSFTVQAESNGDSGVAFNGTHYLVAYNEVVANGSYVLRARRLTREGDAVGSLIELGAGSTYIDVASDGIDWMVAYSVANGVTQRVVAADGTVGPPGSTLAVYAPWITWGGSSYWLAGDSSSGPTATARVARIDRSGNELGSQVYEEPRGVQTRIAFGGSNAFVALSDVYQIAWGSRVNENLERLDTPPLLLSPCESWQRQVRTAWGGSEYFAVWWEGGNPAIIADDHIAARRVGADGTPLGSNIEIPGAVSDLLGPRVASNGNGYLVAWQDAQSPTGTGILGARLSPTGTVLDAVAISSEPGIEPAVASNGTDYYVVWRENNAARGIRLLADGTFPTGAVTISHSTVSTAPAVGFNGSSYLVAWGGAGVSASRVSSTGTVLDASDLAISPQSEGALQPQIASAGSDWLVVWSTGGTELALRGARVGADGAVKDAPAITVNAAGSFQPAAVWTGREYLVAWFSPLGDNHYGVEGRRVSAQGRLIDSAAFSISTDPYMTYQDSIDISARGSGHALITYARWDPTRPIAPRAKARTYRSDFSEGGDGGGAGADTGGAGGNGGSGGTDGGEAGQSSGAAGEAQGGAGRGGASGSGATGGTATATGGNSSGEGGEADGSGRGSGRAVTEGCGCRLAGDGSNRSAALVALALAAFAFRRRRLRAPLRPVGRVPIDRRNRRFDDGDDGCGKALRGAREEGQAR